MLQAGWRVGVLRIRAGARGKIPIVGGDGIVTGQVIELAECYSIRSPGSLEALLLNQLRALDAGSEAGAFEKRMDSSLFILDREQALLQAMLTGEQTIFQAILPGEQAILQALLTGYRRSSRRSWLTSRRLARATPVAMMAMSSADRLFIGAS